MPQAMLLNYVRNLLSSQYHSAPQFHQSASSPPLPSPCPRTPSPCPPDSPPCPIRQTASAWMCPVPSRRTSLAGRTAWSVHPSRSQGLRRWCPARTTVVEEGISE